VSAPSQHDAREAFAQFATSGTLAALEPHTSGLINYSWLASVASAGSIRSYLLQQINRHVFQRPSDVLENMLRITSHVGRRLAQERAPDPTRRVLSLVTTRDGAAGHVDARGETWRLVPWIEGTRCAERASTQSEARETACAFGRFVRQLTDLPPPALHATIPGFHDTQARVHWLERVIGEDRAQRRTTCREETSALLDRRALAMALGGPPEAGGILVRPVHNDAKIANVLFDVATGEALAVVDLDTTMPGLAAHDFGDLVRSSVSDSEEDERDLARVQVRMPVFAALASGFLAGVGDALTPAERAQLVTGARVIVFEQAVRFLADHLDGDRYYRITRPGHNLDRARAQLRLLESLETASPELEQLVATAPS